MRIAVWHNTLSGGSRRALYYYVRGLIERGHEVECWCPSTANRSYLPLKNLAPERVIPFDASLAAPAGLAGRSVKVLGRMRRMDKICRQAAQEIQSGGFDLLFATTCFCYYMPFIVRHLNIPKVTYLQEPFRYFYEASPTLPWVGRILNGDSSLGARTRSFIADQLKLQGIRIQARREWLNAHACDALLVNSYYSRESVLRAYGCEAKVCYLGIDTTLFCNQRRPREHFIVGLGAFTSAKRIELAIQSIALLPEPRPPLIWIGDAGAADYAEAMRRLAASLGVNFETRMLVSDEEVVETLNRAALLIYTSRLEPFGLAPLEANACGAPVVAVAEGGVRETIKDGLNGFLVDSEPRAIAQAIARLLQDAALARDMGERACQYVQREWNLEKSVDRLEGNLLQVVRASLAQRKVECFAR
jgi:glycosyltransferase involved in cell wall biosynthesis